MKKILKVDDETDINLALKALEEEGFKVDTFDDPLVELDNFKERFYDLLILDIKMPKMNGFKFFQQLKGMDDKVKVCFITAYEMYYRTLREMFPTMEVDCFIAKPIGKKELVSRIEEELNA